MAVDPTQLAEDQEARQRITAAGAPTEFAKGPEQEGFEVAGAADLFKLLGQLPKSVTPPRPKPDVATPPVEQTLPSRPPTFAEEPIVKDRSPLYSYEDVQRQAAPSVLEPPALEEFERRGMQAFPSPDQQIVDQAAEDALRAEKTAKSVTEKGRMTVTAALKNRGVTSQDLLSGERTQSVLQRLEEIKGEVKGIKNGGDFNTTKIQTGEDLHMAIEALSEDFAEEVNVVKRGIITQDETKEEAARIIATDELGFTKELLSRKIGDGSFNAAKTLAARQILVLNMERLLDVYARIKADQSKYYSMPLEEGRTLEYGGAKPEDMLEFRRLLTLQAAIQIQTKGNQTEAARTLNIFNVPVAGGEEAVAFAQNAARLLNESGGGEVTMELLERFGQVAEADEPIKGINIYALKAYGAKTKEVIHQAYMAGLLSNPATQVKNILSTGGYMLYQIPSEILAGAYGEAYRKFLAVRGKDIDPDQVYLRDAFLRMKGWSDSLKDAYSAGALAFRTELPSGGRNRYDLEVYNPVGDVEDTFFAKGLSLAGKSARLPFRFLLGADEFFKVMSARGELYTAVSRRYGDLILQGKTDEEALAEAGMLLLDPKAIDDVLDLKAKYDTMQSDLGALSEATGKIQNNFFGRFLLPFATAPTNSMIRAVENTPLGGAYQALAPKFMGGAKSPRETQMALARGTQGAVAMMMFSQYAAEGRITGSKPRDKAAQEALPPGWQPYSFVVRADDFPRDANGDMLPPYDEYGRPNGNLTYVSYAGFEPVGAIIGISADFTQKVSEMPPSESSIEYFGDLAGLSVAAISEYMSELPMLQGIADINDALRGDGIESILRGPASSVVAGGTVPVPNPLSSLQRGLYDIGMFGGDATLVRPRQDLEYYTLEELMAKDDNGEYIYGTTPQNEPLGPIKYLGKVKGSTLDKVSSAIDGYISMDSYFKDQYDYNAPVYDTFGNVITSTSMSLANNPILFFFNRLLGIRIETDQDLTAAEAGVIAVYGETGKWPIANKTTLEGVPLSHGAQSDWTKLAKGTYVD